MKSIVLIIGLLAYSFGLQAQSDYALFPNDSVTHVSRMAEFPTIELGRDTIDGVVYQNLHPTYHQLIHSPSITTSNGFGHFPWANEHWFGKNIHYDSNGVYRFYGQFDILFILNTQTSVGSSWNMANYSNGNVLKAKVDSIIYDSFLGIDDSLKYISLTRRNQNGSIITDGINGSQIIISKENGLIQSLGFLSVSYIDFDEGDTDNYLFQLSGFIMDSTDIAETNRYKIWDLEVGDEYHFSYYKCDLPTVRRQIKIIGKSWTSTPPTFIYHKQLKKAVSTMVLQNGQYVVAYPIVEESSYYDTVYLDDYLFLDTVLLGIDTLAAEKYAKGRFNDELFNVGKQLNNFDIDSIWNWWEGQMTPYGTLNYYVEGIGGPFYSIGSDQGDCKVRRLQYIKKGNYEWGGSYNLSQDEEFTATLSLYPNPVKNELFIDLPKGKKGAIHLVDVSGIIIREVKTDEENSKYVLNVSDRSPGVYFIRIIQNEEEVITKKIIIQ